MFRAGDACDEILDGGHAALGDTAEVVADAIDNARDCACDGVGGAGIRHAGMRLRRCRLLLVGQRLAERDEIVAAGLSAHDRKEFALLLFDVMSYVLDENGDLGIEALMTGVHVGELRQQPLHDVVLFEAFEGNGLGVGNYLAGERVEDLLLDRCMHRKFFDDPVDDLALLYVCSRPGLLEPLEQLLDGVVVIFEKGDCVHDKELPARETSQTTGAAGSV